MSITLPPTPRDFHIHHLCLVQFQSTRRVAEIHHLSQTRVRQIVARVSHWLAATLPVKTDLEIQQQAQLARHLAADQMRHQLESLQNIFDANGDPKYLRHQTRVIAALARLGVIPGAIEALAADATTGLYDPTQPQPPWSEDDPNVNSALQSARLPVGERSSTTAGPSKRCAEAAVPDSSFIPHPSSFVPPPSEDCSLQNGASFVDAPSPSELAAATSDAVTTSAANRHLDETDLRGLNLIEKRLLILIDNTAPAETDRLASLHNTLDEIRASKATLELRLSPHIPGAELRHNPTSPPQRSEQEVTETTEIRS